MSVACALAVRSRKSGRVVSVIARSIVILVQSCSLISGSKTADLDDKDVIDKLITALCYWFGKSWRMTVVEGQSKRHLLPDCT